MPNPFIVFDLEASSFNTGLANSFLNGDGRGADLIQEFVRTSSDPSRLQQHPLFQAHQRSQILQVYATGGAFQGGDEGWVRPFDEMRRFNRPIGNSLYDESDFALRHSLLSKAQGGRNYEAQRVEQLYQGISDSIRSHGKAVLGGHNIGSYDLWRLEYATYQHDSLRNRRGWLADQVRTGRLMLRDSDAELLGAASAFARQDADFAAHHLKGATDVASAKWVSGHNLTNITEAMGYRNTNAHNALDDTLGNVAFFGDIDSGKAFTPESLRSIFPRQAAAATREAAPLRATVAEAATEARSLFTGGEKKFLIGAAVAAAAAAVGSLIAHSTRRDRQTQITGLGETGMGAQGRHRLTDFGSGYQGLSTSPNPFQLESEAAYNPLVRALGVGVTGSALYGAHRYMLATSPNYAKRLHGAALKFEQYSPMHLGRTFAASERFSSYLPSKLVFTRGMLTNDDGTLNEVGQTFDRQFSAAGHKFDFLNEVTEDNPLVFEGRRRAGSGSLQLQGRGIDIETRFVPSEGRLAGTAARLDQALVNHPIRRSQAQSSVKQAWGDFQAVRRSQRISNASPWSEVASAEKLYRPFYTQGHVADPADELFSQARNAWTRLRVEGLEATERTQRLFAEAGFGLKAGTWNKAAHLPFVGEGGMLNQMLTKRVAPLVLAATALGWLDYKLGHPSNKIVDLGLKANVLRADLTDMVPGARGVTDFYDKVTPGSQYGPLALPLAGAFFGGVYHYGKLLGGKYADEAARTLGARILPEMKGLRNFTAKGGKLVSVEGASAIWKSLGAPGKGAAIGLAAMALFVPGMLGSRKSGADLRDIYSGSEPIPIRSGRWWEVGSTPYEGGRIKEWRPHWSVLRKSHAEDISLYGSEKDKWKHNPILHPLKYARDPYWLEKQHYYDRPYPVASPAFSNVPLIGPLLAATVGKLVKPPVRMHEENWNGEDYTLYSTRLEPKGPGAVAPPRPEDEFTLRHALKQEVGILAEYTGLYGFIASSAYQAIFPGVNQGKDVYFQGSRQMDNFSRRYYERELGAGIAPSPSMKEHFGYTEPFRRFVQREDFSPQANPLRNQMPGWLPGADYLTNFQIGDPFTKVDEGYARLPGAGYEALHPELKGLKPEDYPDINKLAILGDVAPYSREYNIFRSKVGADSADNTELRIEYEKILDRVRQTRESVIRMDARRFTEPVAELEGTVETATPGGVTLKEHPGQLFQFSSVSMSAASMSASILGEHNNLTRAEVAGQVDERHQKLQDYLAGMVGSKAHLTVPDGTLGRAERARAVIEVDGKNLNRELIDQGYGQYQERLGGAEAQEMFGAAGKTMGSIAEALAFQGDSGRLNPMRYIPTPGHTKAWQERTPLAQYMTNEVVGTRMRRWERPIHDFLMPYARGAWQRMSGKALIPEDVQVRRDLNTLGDTMQYLRGLNAETSGTYTNKKQRTSVGANLFAASTFVASTLPARESHYFRQFLNETDPEKRASILEVASTEMQRALSAQWVAQEARIQVANGEDPGPIGEGGRLYTQANVEDYKKTDTSLDYGNWLRSKEIADFFSRTGFALPEQGSAAYDEALDYEDVKLKLIQQEGYDSHDFNIFDDRAAMLWRKPYVDGAVRELTSGDDRSPEQLRRAVEQLMTASHDARSDVRTAVHASHTNRASIRVDVSVDESDALVRDIRRNPDKYAQET